MTVFIDIVPAKEVVLSNTLNKTAIFFGDSITYGHSGTPVGYSWANFLNDNYDFKKCVNAGRGGGMISDKQSEKWLVNNLESHKNEKYDYVILHGGTNDIAKGVALGSYRKNDFSGKYDSKTFIGGLETYIYKAKKYWPEAKFGYIINYKTPNETNKNRIHLSVIYYNKMKEVLDKWNIPYLNLFNGKTEDSVNFEDILKVNTDNYIADALHLNKEGYDVISPYIYDWIKNL